MKPEFVGNRNGNTLAAALRGHLDWLSETYGGPRSQANRSGIIRVPIRRALGELEVAIESVSP